MSKYCPEKRNYTVYLDYQECTEKICEAFFCLVVGSRTFNDYDLLCNKLDHLLQNQDKIVIVSGGAKGADSLAERYAKEHNYELIIFPAKWDELGKRAGYVRNTEMHEFISHFSKRGCVAFWDGKSKGTKHNFDLAKKHNTTIKTIRFAISNSAKLPNLKGQSN